MNNRRNIIVNIIYIILGAGLIIASKLNDLNSLYTGFGSGLTIVGVAQLIKAVRYSTDKNYKEKVDLSVKDERSSFIRTKAWAWTGYITVIVAAAVDIIFLIIGLEQYVSIASMIVCGIIIIYLISYMILKNKY